MPQPSVNVIMVADTAYQVTRSEKITILIETTATLQFRRNPTGGTVAPWITLTPSNLTSPAATPEGAAELDGMEGEFQVTTVTGEVSFTRWKSAQG